MRALLQRVCAASVEVQGDEIACIGRGLVVLLGVMQGDGDDDADRLADRTAGLRIFADSAKPMNASVVDISGDALVVSQFTLAADTRRGRRPSFTAAAAPEVAERLYERYVSALARRVRRVMTGRFGTDMRLHLVNDGPVTILLDTHETG